MALLRRSMPIRKQDPVLFFTLSKESLPYHIYMCVYVIKSLYTYTYIYICVCIQPVFIIRKPGHVQNSIPWLQTGHQFYQYEAKAPCCVDPRILEKKQNAKFAGRVHEEIIRTESVDTEELGIEPLKVPKSSNHPQHPTVPKPIM